MKILKTNSVMFRNNLVKSSDDFFIDSKRRQNISVIFRMDEFCISTWCDGTFIKKYYSATVEKFASQELLQLRICDLCDKTKMFIATIDGGVFEGLKQDQSLHVTFSGFIENFITILNHCGNGALQVRLIQENEEFNLQFYEVRSFKNLIHLCLHMEVAPVSTVLYHVNETIFILQKQNSAQERSLRNFEAELCDRNDKIMQLNDELKNLNLKIEEERRTVRSHESQEIKQLHRTIKSMSQAKDSEEMRYKELINNLRSDIEKLTVEKNSLKEINIQETKKYEQLREEMNAYKQKVGNIKDQNEKLVGEIASLRNLERKNEIHNSDLRKQVQELRQSIEKLQKQNSEFAAELEAERKICQTKRNALQLTTEEISKANEIIKKQTKEISGLRKTIDWRTEVALKQEIVIRDKEKEISTYMENIKILEKALSVKEAEQKQFLGQIQTFDQLATKIEAKYSTRISELAAKISLLLKDRKT